MLAEKLRKRTEKSDGGGGGLRGSVNKAMCNSVAQAARCPNRMLTAKNHTAGWLVQPGLLAKGWDHHWDAGASLLSGRVSCAPCAACLPAVAKHEAQSREGSLRLRDLNSFQGCANSASRELGMSKSIEFDSVYQQLRLSVKTDETCRSLTNIYDD